MKRYCVVGYFYDRNYKVEGRSENEAYDNLQGCSEYVGSNEDDWEVVGYVNENDMPADGIIDEEDDKPKIYEFDCIKWPNGCLVEADSDGDAKRQASALFAAAEDNPDTMETFIVGGHDKRFDGTSLGYHSYFSEKYGLYDYF